MSKTITQSSIKCFNECKRAYKYKYVDCVKKAVSEECLQTGSNVHKALECYFWGDELPVMDIKTEALVMGWINHMASSDIFKNKPAYKIEYNFALPVRNPFTGNSSPQK